MNIIYRKIKNFSQAGRLVSPKFNNQFINRFNVDTAASNISPFSFQPSFQKSVIVEPIRSQPSASYYKSQNPEASSRVLKLENDLNQDSYHYAYETENNIRGEENGRVINQNTKNEGIAATGFYEYVGPDNVKYRIEYIADENGFQAAGSHLPTPPPIPEEIARVLANIRN